MNDADKSPIERFKEFVSEILTVTKDDVQKVEQSRKAELTPKPPAKRKGKKPR